MKRTLFPVVAMAALTGCASLQSGAERPHYDYAQPAVVAPGYPVERMPVPSGFEYDSSESDQQRRGYAKASNQGSADSTMDSYTFVKRDDGFATATAMYRQIQTGSRWLPIEKTDGYEFVGGHKVVHLFRSSRLEDLVYNTDVLRGTSEECGRAVDISTDSKDQRRRLIGMYVEAAPCEALALTSGAEWQDLLSRSYEVFGLR